MPDSGWYPDPGSPGSERYWDGNAWTTSTRPTASAPAPPIPAYQPPPQQPGFGAPAQPSYEQPSYEQPSYGQPSYGQQAPQFPAMGGGAGTPNQPWSQPAGQYVPYGAQTPSGAVGAEYGKRVLAYLIDGLLVGIPIGVAYVVFFIAIGAGSASDNGGVAAIGLLFFAAILLAAIAFGIWNTIFRQGKTGQTIGKSKVGLRLVSEATGQPPGIGSAAIRYIVPALVSNVTCGIFGIVDILSPLWDARNQKISDKWFKLMVYDAPKS